LDYCVAFNGLAFRFPEAVVSAFLLLKPSSRRNLVSIGFRRLQGNTALSKLVDDALQVTHVAGQTIDPRDHQRVAFPRELKQRRKFFSSFCARAGNLLFPDDGAAGRKAG
jgi:hypothetical protein